MIVIRKALDKNSLKVQYLRFEISNVTVPYLVVETSLKTTMCFTYSCRTLCVQIRIRFHKLYSILYIQTVYVQPYCNECFRDVNIVINGAIILYFCNGSVTLTLVFCST